MTAAGITTPAEVQTVVGTAPEPITKCRKLISTGAQVAANDAAAPGATMGNGSSTSLAATTAGAAGAASDDAKNVTGTTLYVDSGYHAMGM